MKVYSIMYIFVLILFITMTSAATQWVADPVDCPSSDGTNFPGQNCAPEDICGDSSGTAQCFDTSTINEPAGSVSTSADNFGGFDGGYVINCYASVDSGSPFCDNEGSAWCDRQDSCYNVGRQTTCTGGSWNTATCSASCRTDGNNHFACDGSTTDPDGCEIRVGDSCGAGTGSVDSAETCFDANNGDCTRISDYRDCDDDDGDADELTCNGVNGCELDPGSACSVGGLDGSYANSCPATCVLDDVDIATSGTEVLWSTSATNPLLWLKDFGSGNIVFFNTSSDNIFHINDTGAFWNSFDLSTDNTGGGNTSWNQTLATSLYEPIGITESDISDLTHTSAGNLSWNQTLATLLFTNIQWDYNQTAPAQEYADANDADTIFSNTNVCYLNNTQTYTGENTFTANVTITANLTVASSSFYDNGTCSIWVRGDSQIALCD